MKGCNNIYYLIYHKGKCLISSLFTSKKYAPRMAVGLASRLHDPSISRIRKISIRELDCDQFHTFSMNTQTRLAQSHKQSMVNSGQLSRINDNPLSTQEYLGVEPPPDHLPDKKDNPRIHQVSRSMPSLSFESAYL